MNISAKHVIQTTNLRICDFYNKHSNINFDAVNLWMIEFLEKIVSVNAVDIPITNTLIQQLNAVKNKMIKCLKEINIDESAVIIQLTFLNDNILSIITEQNPNTPLHIYTKVNELLKEDKNDIIQIIPQNSINNFYATEFINKLDDMLNKLFQSIYVLINSNETLITQQINSLKINSTDLTSQMYMDFAQPRNRPSSPSITEQRMLSNILSKLYTSAEIISGPELNEDEIILKRMRKTNILIKNHELETNILLDDITNCIQLAEDQRCNCIIISQYSGISTKKNYQIDIQNNMIIVYVHTAEYNHSKIQAAVDIIDNLSSKLNQYKTKNEDDIVIPKDIMDTINEEYQLFISQKIAVVDVFKDHQKKVLAQIDELRFPSLDKLLSTKYLAPVAKPGIKCELCKSYFANNLKALAAHKRGCARKINGKHRIMSII